MMGWAALRSTSTKMRRSTTPAPTLAAVIGEVHPSSAVLMMPNTSAPIPSVALSAPNTSNRPRARPVSGRNRGARAIIAAPIGTLTKNPARQEIQWASAPPPTRPRLAPIPAVAPYKATARVRSRPSGKLAVSRESEAGATIAAPIPCTARPAIAHQPAGARPINRDATENTTKPKTNTRRRPSRSPARAPSSSRPPKTSV